MAHGFSCELPVIPGGNIIQNVQYTIHSPQRKTVYVTRTANFWPQPITSARFIVAPGVQSNYHSPLESVVEFNSFRPKENWEISW